MPNSHDTLRFSRDIDVPLDRVWPAYVDVETAVNGRFPEGVGRRT